MINPNISPSTKYSEEAQFEDLHQYLQSVRSLFAKSEFSSAYLMIQKDRRRLASDPLKLLVLDVLEGHYHYEKQQYKTSLDLLRKTEQRLLAARLQHPENQNLLFVVMVINQVYAYNYTHLHLQSKAMIHCTEAHKIASQLGRQDYEGSLLYLMACICYSEGNLEKSLDYCLKAKEGPVLVPTNLANIIDLLALCYTDQKQFSTAVIYRQEAVDIALKAGNLSSAISKYVGFSYTCVEMGDAQGAHEKLQLAEELRQQIEAPSEVDLQTKIKLLKTGWINYYISIGEYHKAKDLFEGEACFRNLSILESLDFYERMQEVYVRLGDRKQAVDNFENYRVLTAKLYSQQRAEVESAQEVQFNTVRVEAEANYNLKLFQQEKEYRRQKQELLQKQQDANKALQREKTKVELKSLAKQMDPHFMFNSLNSISSYVLENDKEAANRYLSRYSKLMQKTIDYSLNDMISLEEEIEILKLYLDLEVLRFGQKFDYKIEVHDELNPSNFHIPPMLLQPQAENAVWHGLRQRTEPEGGLLILSFAKQEQLLICTVTDNGIGVKKARTLKQSRAKQHTSFSTSNIERRLELLNSLLEQDIQMEVDHCPFQEEDNCGTSICIKIPISSMDSFA